MVSHIRGEHRLEEFENRVLRNIFGPEREKVLRGWRNLHKEELHNLYYSIHIFRVVKSRMISQTGHAACMEEKNCAYRVLVDKAEGKRQLGRPRHKWADNIKMNLKEIGWEGMEWINLA